MESGQQEKVSFEHEGEEFEIEIVKDLSSQ
jgi:hypothetical protein